ncbi:MULTISPECIES: hypothetical protein [unclassified Massilia]|uniref:hypothetical protein n=1 Tax=unclassified Massilia TaxID=2609279 RepID=UPI001B819C41|nr:MULTISPECIES: hypothetical protein [unclassified Massilia]MBQ5940618.1 hypothetical protein [Massilia sp. AB1]MBQ5961748.1 hypothetical protein [Massilia sp. ZL223]
MLECKKRDEDKHEIDYRTMKLMVAAISLTLSGLTLYFAEGPLASISHAYCADGMSRDIFVGFLFAIAAIMSAHNGADDCEKVASRLAAVSALGVALVPTSCRDDVASTWHFLFAAAVFAILAWFCWSFYRRAGTKPHPEYAARRKIVYGICGIGILAMMGLIAAHKFFGLWPAFNVTFNGEAIGLALFGVSWLVASHFLPYFDHPGERMKVTKPPVPQA